MVVISLAPYLVKREKSKPQGRRAGAGAMSPIKQKMAVVTAVFKAQQALVQENGNMQDAIELLWSWSRQDTALQTALIRYAVAKLIKGDLTDQ